MQHMGPNESKRYLSNLQNGKTVIKRSCSGSKCSRTELMSRKITSQLSALAASFLTQHPFQTLKWDLVDLCVLVTPSESHLISMPHHRWRNLWTEQKILRVEEYGQGKVNGSPSYVGKVATCSHQLFQVSMMPSPSTKAAWHRRTPRPRRPRDFDATSMDSKVHVGPGGSDTQWQ